MKSKSRCVAVCGTLSARQLALSSCNDPYWQEPLDAASAFEPVRAALAGTQNGSALQALTQALRASHHPTEFRRWLRQRIGRANESDGSLLRAYQQYFEQQSH